jgi:hypothetical protein
MTSVERVHEYSMIRSEGINAIEESSFSIPASSPSPLPVKLMGSEGALEFRNVVMSYSKTFDLKLPPALNGATFSCMPRDKVSLSYFN